uniref:Rho GTPase-activating protein 18 n=2 Tax=Cacopsylla melanoneura TaxID=428564 RepID=A0A8D8QRU7_9HEMI
MLGYHRLGSVRYRGGWGGGGVEGGGVGVGGGVERMRSGSDPLNLSSNVSSDSQESPNSLCVPRVRPPVTRSHGSLFELASPLTPPPSQSTSLGLSASHESLGRHGSDCLGFEDMWSDQADTSLAYQPESLSEEVNVGRTWVDSLGDEDQSKLRPLLFLELTALFDSCHLRFHKRKPYKRKRREDGSIFGASLSSLVEKDGSIVVEPRPLPLVFQKLFDHLERRGLKEEGILRVAAHKTKVERLCAELEREFYTHPERVDQILASCQVHDLTAILKRLLRDLPQPLLTSELTHLFYETHLLPDCTRALNLLVLLLPPENRALLVALLMFMAHLVAQQGTNKMSAHNVAMIIAPSLFPPRYVRSNKGDLKAEISMAAISCRLTETLMVCADNLCIVPCELVTQLRLSNEQTKHSKENHKPMMKLPWKSCNGGPTRGDPGPKEDSQDGILRVSAHQFQVDMFPMTIGEITTAGDVILRIVEEANLRDSELRSQRTKPSGPRRDLKARGALTDLAPNGNLSCLLTTADPDLALQTHFLYEMGGNIGQRRIEPSAMMLAVYQSNPTASWEVKCDHRNGIKQYQNDR